MKFPLILITLDERTVSVYYSKEALEREIEIYDIDLVKVFDSDACLYKLDIVKEIPEKLLYRLLLGSRDVVRIVKQLPTTEADRKELKHFLLYNLKEDGIITTPEVAVHELPRLIELLIEHEKRYKRH